MPPCTGSEPRHNSTPDRGFHAEHRPLEFEVATFIEGKRQCRTVLRKKPDFVGAEHLRCKVEELFAADTQCGLDCLPLRQIEARILEHHRQPSCAADHQESSDPVYARLRSCRIV